MLKRAMSPPGLTADAVKQAFGLPKGGAGYAETSDRAGRVVFQVKEIVPAATPTPEQSDKLAKELKQQLEGDYLLAYIAALKNDLDVRVNEAELKRVTGASTDGQQ
jgi:peptidyl-prolyl cis-trans isomerase D